MESLAERIKANPREYEIRLLQHAMFTPPEKCMFNNSCPPMTEFGIDILNLIQEKKLQIKGMNKDGSLIMNIINV